MTEAGQSEVLGRWRITEITGWDADYVDMVGPGYIQLDRDGAEMAFGVVQSGLECGYADLNQTARWPVKSTSTTATTCHSSPNAGEFPHAACLMTFPALSGKEGVLSASCNSPTAGWVGSVQCWP